ncbi:MAG: TIGR03751 family conjugal transfer lipoprotein [bacterium]|nr:TIGR03751 family conjugal transfer lipoprotein [bacterium]
MDADDSDMNTPATLDYGGSEINPQERTEMANNTGVVGQEINPPDVDLAAYTRQADNEIQGLFPRLSNPDLVIYVYPHLSGLERVPIPGYATTFPMYKGIEYALPGEIPVP